MRLAVGGTACIGSLVCACTLTTPLDDLAAGGTGAASTTSSGASTSASSSSSTSSSTSPSSASAGGSMSAGGHGGSPPMFDCGLNGSDTLQDDFDDGVIGGAWGWFESSSLADVKEANGELVITVSGGSQTLWANVRSVLAYDLTSCFAHVHVTEALSDTPGIFVGLTLYLPSGDTNYLEIAKIGAGLRAAVYVAGTPNILATVDYNPSQHAWWRIREDGGTLYFEASANGSSYDIVATGAVPFDITALELSLIAGTDPSTISQETARFDRFNLPP